MLNQGLVSKQFFLLLLSIGSEILLILLYLIIFKIYENLRFEICGLGFGDFGEFILENFKNPKKILKKHKLKAENSGPRRVWKKFSLSREQEKQARNFQFRCFVFIKKPAQAAKLC